MLTDVIGIDHIAYLYYLFDLKESYIVRIRMEGIHRFGSVQETSHATKTFGG